MIDLSTFKTFDFSEGFPYASITNHGITFNKSVIMKLGYPTFVRLLIDDVNKQIAVQVCEENEDKSVSFYKENARSIYSVRWNARDLLSTIERFMDWDLETSSYRVNGVLIPEYSLMLFDLNKATLLA
ncbi:MAG: hypothetical protein E7191_02645 [Erysipelotrichaceae bacterium]|nr:hypothetical protein [Erysipelotrichaceae bacterium]